MNMEERGIFLRVKCKKCKNEQVIFNKASTKVKCIVCETLLASPRGGQADIKTKIIEALGK